MTEIVSIADVFAAMGGVTALARAIGVGPSTASEMKRRGGIPAEYWTDLVRAARQRSHPEITTDLLAQLHARGKPEEGSGLAEESHPYAGKMEDTPSIASPALEGQFSRWKHLRRSHFASGREVEEHIRALREEWDRR